MRRIDFRGRLLTAARGDARPGIENRHACEWLVDMINRNGRNLTARIGLPIVFVVITVLFTFTAASANEPVAWLTGEKLKSQLEQNVGATWEAIPLRRAITSLSRSQRVAILLDRRVDPDQKIDLSFTDVPLERRLKLIAGKLQIGVAQVGPVIYLGPAATAEKLRTLSALRNDRGAAVAFAGAVAGIEPATDALGR